MIGLPGQTLGDLADDILFYRDMDIDMIGMAPTSSITIHRSAKTSWLPVWTVPKKETAPGTGPQDDRRHAPLPARRQHRRYDGPPGPPSPGTGTGPQSRGQRSHAHRHGHKYRPQYLLYDNKPCVDEVPDQCKNCLSARVASVGDTIGLGQWGDSPHFFHKK